MSNHTGGPWRVHKRWHILGYDDTCVANVVPWDTSGCREEDHANARLIAAAPELLEALKALAGVFVWDAPVHDYTIGDYDNALAQAKDAIAKAKAVLRFIREAQNDRNGV